MGFECFSSIDDTPQSFVRLLIDAGKENFFLSDRWFQNFLRNTLEDDARSLVVCIDGVNDRPGAVLVARTPAGQNGSIFQGARLPKPSLASMTNHQSVFFSLILAADTSGFQEITQSLAAFFGEKGSRWKVLTFDHLDPGCRGFEVLRDALTLAGMTTIVHHFNQLIFERTKGCSFDEFLSCRASIVRKTFQRKARKLDRSGDVRFELIQDKRAVDVGMANYEEVLRDSWKEPEPFPDHTLGVVRAAAEGGELRLGLLFFNDKPVAAQIWIVSGGCATIYKLHYNMSMQKESVGSVLTLEMFRHVLDTDRVEEINFGLGVESYKKNWLTDERSQVGVVAFNARTASGSLALVRFRATRAYSACRRRLVAMLRRLMSLRSKP